MMDSVHFFIGILVLFLSHTDYAVSLSKRQLVMYEKPVTWNEAYKICVADGGQLMKYYSIEDDKAIDKLLGEGPGDDFWIGLNSKDTSTGTESDFVFADCQSISSSWTKWEDGFKSEGNKGCVIAKKDTRKWYREKCSIEKNNFLCELPRGECTYDTVKANCPIGGGTEDLSAINTDSECRDKCQNAQKNGKYCFAYKFDSACMLYFSTDPYFCDNQSGSTDVNLRRCYLYKTGKGTTVTSNTADGPDARTCTNYIPPTTTTLPTTTTTLTTTTEQTTTSTLPPTTSTTSQATTTPPPTTTSVPPTTTSVPPTTTTILPPTTSSTTTSSTEPPTTTTSQPTATSTPLPKTIILPPTSSTTTSSTEPLTTTTILPLTSSKPTITSVSPTTPNTIIQTSTNTLTLSEISTDTTICVCDICGTRNMTSIKEEMIKVMNFLKVNNAELSSTRRKKESATDERPSAQNIGYIGVFIVIGIFGVICVSDLKKIYSDMSWIFR